MVKKTTHPSKTRGRPPKFDREAVISAAIDAFWDHGLATTLPDIEAATGVDRKTLYNSFGGKVGLYELANARYLEQAEAWLFAPLFEGSNGLGDIVEFLERLKTGLTSTGAKPGCLIVNDMGASTDKRPGERYQQLLESGLLAALAPADAAPDTTGEQRAGLIAAAVIGINLMSKTGRSPADLEHLINSVIAQVHLWQLEAKP